MTASTLEMPLYDAREGNAKVRACIFCGDVLQQHIGNMNKTTEFARGLDFIVTIDPYFTEGAKWADVILPATTRFENDAEVGSVKIGYSNIVLQNKIIEPLFEARTDFWIGKEIAKRFGKDQYLPATSEEWVKVLASSRAVRLRAHHRQDQRCEQRVSPRGHRGAAPSSPRVRHPPRAWTSTTTLLWNTVRLPAYEPPLEAHAGNKLAETYPLQLANVRTRYRIHNQFNDAKWIQQFAEPRIELNPSEMEKRGLATGDAVEVFNDRGSFKCRVKANESIRPGSARMFEGQTADFLIEGNVQNVTNDGYVERGAELMCGPVIPFSDTLVEIKKA
ncbi:MAG: molybdopterin dinucleotide binding domain-containing protein [Eggerthella lenta]